MSTRARLTALAAVSTVLASGLVACSDDGSSPSAEAAPSEPAASEATPPEATKSAPAADLHVADPAGDVDDAGTARRATAAGALTNVDVLGADLDRTREALSVTVTYADLDLDADGQWGIYLALRTSEDSLLREVTWERGVYADTGKRYEQAGMTRSTPQDTLDNPCRRLRVSDDPEARTVTIRVPNSCLGDPDWVRVVSLATDGVPPDDATHFTDDLFDGSAGRSWPRLAAQP